MSRDVSYDDADFLAEARKLSAAARRAPADYGTTIAALDELDAELDALEAAELTESADYTAYRASVKATAAKRTPAEAGFRALRLDTYDHASEEQQIEGGLEPHKKPSKTAPTPPLNLTVEGGVNGINALAYEAGENIAGTEYVLYETDSLQTPWQMFDVVSTLRAKQSGQVVGKTKYYQVRARRRGILSEPSNVAVVFGN